MIIRSETPADIEEIAKVTLAAFESHHISQHTEQFIIAALRAAKALTLSIVADADGRIVGHIAFSPVTIADGSPNWYGLGPLSVLPELQRQGIGKALVHEGLSLLKGLGGEGCALVGDPNYYRRFGFRNIPDMVFEGIPQEFFVVLPFRERVPRGVVTFHEAFLATG